MLDLHISTKLSVPATRSNLLQRTHLWQQIDEVIDHKVLLVAAPAGFGKTSLISAWSGQSAWPVAWLTLDAADNDPATFWSYLVGALAPLDTGIEDYVLPLVNAPRPMLVEHLLPTLVNALARIPEHVVIVLDDYHGIETGAIHTAIASLIDYLPPNGHVILSSRTDPPLPLAQWRARGHLYELRAADLRFSAEETVALFSQTNGYHLSTAQIADVQQRTEGWIAGLHLLALAAERRSFSLLGETSQHPDDQMFIIDYLASEVLRQQPEQIQTFLLQTAVLETLNSSLCDALTGRSDSQTIIEEVRQRELFIATLGKDAYRFHPIFGDFLRGQLQRDGRFDQAELHQRAADWYEAHDDLARAIDHTLAAGLTAPAIRRIEQVMERHRTQGGLETLRRWLSALPEASILERPRLGLVYAWSLASAGDSRHALRFLETLEAHAAARGTLPDLRGDVAAVRTRIAVLQQDTGHTIAYAQQALDLLPPDAPERSDVLLDLAFTYRGQGQYEAAQHAFEETLRLSQRADSLRTGLMASYYLADLLIVQGRLHQAARLYQQGIQWGRPSGQPVVCWMEAGLGALHYEWNDLAAAHEHLRSAIDHAQVGGEIKILMYAPITLALTLSALQRPDEALAALDGAAQIARQMRMTDIASAIDVARMKVWLSAGQVTTAEQWLRSNGVSVQHESLADDELTMLAWFALARHRADPTADDALLDRASALLAARCEETAAQPLLFAHVQRLLLLALTYQATDQHEKAVHTLDHALTLAEPLSLVRTFGEHGAAMATLLRQSRVRDSAYLAQRIAACEPTTTRTEPTPPHHPAQDEPYSEPLQRREIEVLRHVANGLSNQEIADEMIMAISTIKWYLRNIYSKLHVGSRTQALARAREMEII